MVYTPKPTSLGNVPMQIKNNKAIA